MSSKKNNNKWCLKIQTLIWNQVARTKIMSSMRCIVLFKIHCYNSRECESWSAKKKLKKKNKDEGNTKQKNHQIH